MACIYDKTGNEEYETFLDKYFEKKYKIGERNFRRVAYKVTAMFDLHVVCYFMVLLG